MAELFTLPARATDSNGDNLSGAKLYFYATGTSTPQNVYSDSDLSTSLGAVVTADGGGKFVGIYLDPVLTYRAALKTSDGATTIYDLDPVGSGFYRFLANNGVNAKNYGAVGNGVATGEQTAINKALATGKDVFIPAGTYLLSDAVISTTPGQVIRGAGRALTVLKVPATFNLSATGVLYSNTGEPGFDVRDLTIEFVQPDTAVRGNLVAYPPAIYAQATPRFRVSGVRIIGAKTGIDMRGNSGGVIVDGLEISSFDYAIRIDGSLDTVRVLNLHHWPFGLTANQQSIFYDSSNIGLESGRCDDLKLHGALFIGGGKQLRFITGSGGGDTFGTVSDTQFDTWGAVEMTAGNVLMVNCSWSAGSSGVRPVLHTGGNLRISSANFEAAVALTNPMVESSMSSGGASYLAVLGSIFRLSGDNKAIRVAASSGQANALVNSNQFVLPQNTSPTNAVADVAAGARITFTDNRASDKGTGTGNLLAIAQDNFHIVGDNSFLNWGMSLPASWTNIAAFNNSAVAQGDIISTRLVGKLQFMRLTGTADGAGAASIAHGIASGNLKVLTATAAYKGGSAEWRPCAVNFIDGTNVNVTGAGASAKVRVWITYTETQDAW